jgi:hypothetical protein
MKKFLPILLAAALCLPALADVTVSVSDATGGVAQINLAITGTSVVRGVALKVTVTGAEADIDAASDLTVVETGFNAYVDYYYSNPSFLGGLVDENDLPGGGAHALADPDAAGVLDLATAKSVFSICLGALDNSGAQGGVDNTTGGVLATIQLDNFADASAQVCVEPDGLRGGIVGDDLGVVTDTACGDIAEPVPPTCFSDNLGNFTEWDNFGRPDCWCYEFNCRGDADGKTEGTTKTGIKKVYLLDLGILSSAYNVLEPTPGILSIPNGICADFDRAAEGTTKTGIKRVYLLDLGILSTNYNKVQPDGISSCPLVGAGGEINYYTIAP